MGNVVKILLVVAALVSTAVAGFLAGGHPAFQAERAEDRAAGMDTSRIDRLEQRLSRLTNRIEDVQETERADATGSEEDRKLSDRIDELTEAIAALQRENDSRSASQDQSESSLRKTDPRKYYEQMREKARERQAHIDKTFADQPRDEIWANSMAVEIEEAFQRPELSAGRLAKAECRSTMCRVEVLHDSRNSTELFEFQNHLLINLAEEFPTAYTRQVEGADGPRTVVHFVRQGEELPRLDDSSTGGAGR